MSETLDLREQYRGRRAASSKLHESFTNAQELSATLATQIQLGNAPWQIAREPGQQYLPWNPSTGRDFSAGNAVSLMSQAQEAGYSDTRWLTSRQTEREGGQVRPGEQGTRIEFWQYGGIENGRAVQYEQPRVFSTTVFNAEQIDGLEAAPDRSRASRLAPQEVASDQDTYPFGSEGHAKRALRKELEALIIGSQDGTGFQPRRSEAQADQWVKALQNDPREIYRAAADASRTVEQRRHLELDAFLDADTSLRGKASSLAEAEIFPRRDPVLRTFIRSEHTAMSPSDDQRVYLAVPFAEKDDAKQAGAKWDKAEKAWFVPAGVALDGFAAWMPAKDSVHIAAGPDPREAFGDALRQAGLQVQGTPEMDGQMHRVQVEGDRGKEKSGAYAGYLDGHPAGFIQNFKTGEKSTWKATGPAAPLSAQDRAQLAGEAAQKRQDRAHDRERMYERTAQQVDAIWAAATPATAHPYLETKIVQAHGTRQAASGTMITVEGKDGQPKQLDVGGQLLVPVRGIEGNLQSLQIIRDDGSKMFMPGGRVDGGHMVIGGLDQPGPLLVAEGFATAATLRQLSGQPVVVAFNAGNLGRVAEIMREEYPDRAIYLAGDNDHLKEAAGKPNVGREKAEAAANAIGGYVLLPSFTPSSRGTDWNDLAKSEGRDIAQFALQAGFRGAERDRLAAAITATRSVDRSASLAPNLTSSEQVGNEPAGIER